ncbi:MAG: hypothetical protein ACOC3E_01180 [Cyanobacteriota bacterium]
MSQNLISSGVINPFLFPVTELYNQVAVILNISQNRIEHIETWKHQLWVKIKGVGGKFVSYRRLSLWMQQGIAAIGKCQSQAELEKLAALFRLELNAYGKQYSSEAIQQWRSVWWAKYQEIKAEAERLKPIQARLEEAEKWQESWRYLLACSRNCNALKRLATDIEEQREMFADVPDVINTVKALWQQRWEQLHSQV